MELFPPDECSAIQAFYASYEPARAQFEYRGLAAQVGHVRNLFYGDSLTAGWRLHEFFPGRSILNRGIGGDSILGLHLRLPEDVFPYHPDRVFMMCGINGIELPEEVILARFRRVGEEIRAHGSSLCVGSICPLRYPDQWNRFQYQEKIVRLNGRLESWCRAEQMTFLDYHGLLRDEDGQLQERYARPDGTHLTVAAYVAMSALVASYLV